MAEKMRVHILAKELNVSSKTIIEKCRAEGIDSVKNHMSTLTAGLQATIQEWFSEGGPEKTALETAKPVDLKKARIKPKRKKTAKATAKAKKKAKEAPAIEAPAAATAVAEAPIRAEEGAPLQPPDTVPGIAAETVTAVEVETETEVLPELPTEAPVEAAAPAETPPETVAAPEPVVKPKPTVTAAEAPSPEVETPSAPAEGTLVVAAETPAEVAPAAEAPAAPAETPPKTTESPREPPEAEPRKPVAPAGPQHVPAPARIQGPRVVRYEAPDHEVRPPRPAPPRGREDRAVETAEPGVGGPVAPAGPERRTERGPGRRRGRINPRRAAGTLREAGERLAEWRDQDLLERQERLAGATGRRIMRRRTAKTSPAAAQAAPVGPKTEATVHEPVQMKEFCSTTGLSFVQLFKVLRDEYDLVANINMTLPTDTAELLALHFGIDLDVLPAKTLLDDLNEEFENRERKNEQARPPVVTMLGHVDHGKTSLLDAIRRTRVAASEDGGITQHLSSYHLKTTHGAVTFLDTPGHEAFTAMRARGAQVTDVVVLVVAADDGVMPQTIEAIHHAQAAKVPIVIALNKIDLGDQNKVKIYGQLAEHGLTPSGEWGGDVDVIATSATNGQGVVELVEHLAELSNLLELKADPALPAKGTVLEAETKPGVGAVARVLVQDGTLHVGDFVVCGNAAGKVRALLNDRGDRVRETGPSIPVEIWGLDDVPLSGDKLYQVDSLQRAKDTAVETKQVRVAGGRQQSRKAKSLQEMLQQRDSDEVPELNLILKGDVDGSVAALRQSLTALPSDEVRLSIRHAGVGPVNDSDILLAGTCNAIVAAFRVEVSVGARRLADEHGVDVRPYRVIYDVCDDIKKALEGLLAPEETIESRASAEVREVFHLSRKAGVVAGSYVKDGLLDRGHLVKIVRDGVIVREEARIASLRRFKDDVKEVRAGMECGIRVEGFDDLHVGDVIESYEIVKTARTL